MSYIESQAWKTKSLKILKLNDEKFFKLINDDIIEIEKMTNPKRKEDAYLIIEDLLSRRNINYDGLLVMGRHYKLKEYIEEYSQYNDIFLIWYLIRNNMPAAEKMSEYVGSMNQERLLKNSLDYIEHYKTWGQDKTNKLTRLYLNKLSLDLSNLDEKYLKLLNPWTRVAIENNYFSKPYEEELKLYNTLINSENSHMTKATEQFLTFQTQRLEAEKAEYRRQERKKIDEAMAYDYVQIPPKRRVNEAFMYKDEYYDSDL